MNDLLNEELEALKAKDLYRRTRVLDRFSEEHARHDGKNLVLFCGNDYLGLARHPRVIRAFREAAETCGVGAGAARLISGTSVYHHALEERLAALKGKARALLFTAGYLANLGAMTAFANEQDLILMDKLCHASLIDGAKLSGATLRVFPHKNYARAEAILKKARGYRRRILVSETVFSMDGDLADLAELVRLKRAYQGFLLLDDAHGTGVFGKTGKGAAEDDPLRDEIDLIVGTLSKALGCLGGFVAGSASAAEYLINRARPFIFATALPPAVCAAAAEALDVLRDEPERRARLWANTRKLRQGLSAAGFSLSPETSPIVPVVLGGEKEALRASEELLSAGFLVPAIRPPTVPKGTARLRMTLSADHRAEDLDRFITTMSLLRSSFSGSLPRGIRR